jgi:hypothetical protein
MIIRGILLGLAHDRPDRVIDLVQAEAVAGEPPDADHGVRT